MNHYETVFILNPVLSEDQMKETVQKFTKLLKESKAKIVAEEHWGLKKMAYSIQKKRTGFYYLIEFTSDDKEINNKLEKDVFITHKLENRYFFPIQDKKIVVAKLGNDFSWFSFVTLFITFYGISLHVYGMYNIYKTLNSIYYFLFIIFLTLVTFIIGYWWFVNNEGESRLRKIYDK